MLLCYLAGLSADFFLRRPLLARQTIVKCIIRVMSSCWEEFRLRLRLIIGRLWFELSSRTFSATRLERWRINMLGSIVGLVMTWSTFRHITILELLCTGLIELGLWRPCVTIFRSVFIAIVASILHQSVYMLDVFIQEVLLVHLFLLLDLNITAMLP